MKKHKEIDYLFEDPPITGQKFALVSIVGPHMPQKCDVWGLKIRGFADSEEKAVNMSKRLNSIDPDFDIYTTEVGKFFPLVVEPNEIENQVHSDSKLNQLIKTYKENREQANEHFYKRKNELIQEAIREGKNQEELSSKPEHPISVLHRIKTFEDKLKELTESLKAVADDLQLARDKYETYSEEERIEAEKQLTGTDEKDKQTSDEDQNKQKNLSVDEIREKLESNKISNVGENSDIENTLAQIQNCEQELIELQELRKTIQQSTSPNVYKKVTNNITETEKKLNNLKKKLQNTEAINKFINSNYSHSELNSMFNSPIIDKESKEV